MKDISHQIGIAILAAATLGASSTNLRAAVVNMGLTGNFSLSATDVGVQKTGAGSFSDAPGQYYIGLYQFQVSSSGTAAFAPGEKFYSICLSPAGNLDMGNYSYNYETFAQAAPGLNPNNANFAEGIQNAMFLWAHYGSTITSGAQGGALAEALYTAYYNYNAPGAITGGFQGGFTPLWGLGSGLAQSYYSTYMNYLTTYGPNGIGAGYQGFLLVPTDPGAGGPSGQEFIVFAPNSVVPEPSTSLAGMLLLMPLGFSTLRILRSKQT